MHVHAANLNVYAFSFVGQAVWHVCGAAWACYVKFNVAQDVGTFVRCVLLCSEAGQFEAFLAAFRFVPQPLARIYICFHGARVPVVLFDELPCHLITAAVGLPLVCYEQCALAFQRVHRGEHHGVAVAGSAIVFDEAM